LNTKGRRKAWQTEEKKNLLLTMNIQLLPCSLSNYKFTLKTEIILLNKRSVRNTTEWNISYEIPGTSEEQHKETKVLNSLWFQSCLVLSGSGPRYLTATEICLLFGPLLYPCLYFPILRNLGKDDMKHNLEKLQASFVHCVNVLTLIL